VRPEVARYDGQSDWYDETFSASHPGEQEAWFRDAGFTLRSVREFVPPGAILPWDLALLATKPG